MLTVEAPLFRIRHGHAVRFTAQPPAPPKPSEAARTLALAHRIVQAVETGEALHFSAAARHMGVHQARVSALVTLTFLAPAIQEDLLLDRPGPSARNLRALLRIARIPSWADQIARYRLRSHPTEAHARL